MIGLYRIPEMSPKKEKYLYAECSGGKKLSTREVATREGEQTLATFPTASYRQVLNPAEPAVSRAGSQHSTNSQRVSCPSLPGV